MTLQAVAFAQALPHSHSLAAAGYFLSTIYQYRGEARAALETAESVAKSRLVMALAFGPR
jgi:hypothetical protein